MKENNPIQFITFGYTIQYMKRKEKERKGKEAEKDKSCLKLIK